MAHVQKQAKRQVYLVVYFKNCRDFLVKRMVAAKEKSAPEIKNRISLITLNDSVDRNLNSVMNQEKLPDIC